MIFRYVTKVKDRDLRYGSGTYTTHDIDWNVTKKCCDEMDYFLKEEFIHFDSFKCMLKIGGAKPVRFCPACGEKIIIEESAKIRQRCVVTTEMVECKTVTWTEELMEKSHDEDSTNAVPVANAGVGYSFDS